MYKKILILTLSLTLLALAAAGGTLTWLSEETEPITNTFTAGDINLELKETTGTSYKMVPGTTIEKDPWVIVKAGSEACYVFVKLEKSANFDDFMTFAVDDTWKALPGYADIYYCQVLYSETDQEINILVDDVVTTKSEITKAQLNALTEETQPKLTVTAYAVQQEAIGNAEDAWKATFGKDSTPNS